uniref:Golgi-resident adenosine 3',5'-bisphosphate 3'-phosphatase n=1 Tax=Myxine glutinosa TaxID=7769 RepID=UPI00358F8F57
MAGLRLSPLGVTVFVVVMLGMIYLMMTRGPHDTPDLIDLRQILALSVEAAELGGQQVRKVKESGDLKGRIKGHTKEGVEEPLTLGDLMSHRAMLGLFLKTYPHLKVISEEHDNSELELIPWSGQIPADMLKQLPPHEIPVPARDITVWLDPLDATKEFTENLLQYVTTMVCVAVKGRPLIGVIHKPFTQLTAWGFANQGMSANLRRRTVDPSKLSFIMSRSHSGIAKDFTQQVFGSNVSIVSAGGAGFKALSLIDVENDMSDKADVYIHTTLIKKWDICAGNAILEAIGGNMTTLTGEKISYDSSPSNDGGLLASAGVNHRQLLNKIAAILKR